MNEPGQIKVLIVDDSRTERFWEEKILTGMGCSVASAVDGTDALKYLLQNGSVDLLLLDLKMPRMDGYELLDEVKKNSDLEQMKVIVLSAQDENEVLPVLGAGADDYWLKGSNTVVLKKKISNLLYTIRLERKIQAVRNILAD